MKKTKIIGALLAGVLALTGAPIIPELATPFSATAEAASKLAAPKNVKATVSGTTVKLSWSAVKGADAYRVYMFDSESGEYKTLKNVSGTSTSVKNLAKGTYNFRVAALVKSGSKFKAQTKSAAVKAKVTGKTSTKTSSVPVSFPSLGTSKDAAIKAMNLSEGMDLKYSSEITAHIGFKNINGENCMVILYFNKNNKYFYGLAALTEKAVKGSDLLSAVRAKLGDETLSKSSKGGNAYMWVNLKTMSVKGVLVVSAAEKGSCYFEISYDLAPASMKNNGKDFDFDQISQLFSFPNA